MVVMRWGRALGSPGSAIGWSSGGTERRGVCGPSGRNTHRGPKAYLTTIGLVSVYVGDLDDACTSRFRLGSGPGDSHDIGG